MPAPRCGWPRHAARTSSAMLASISSRTTLASTAWNTTPSGPIKRAEARSRADLDRDRPANSRGRMADGAIELAFARSALRRCALFALVDDVTLDTVCASLRVRRYRRDETIFHQGDPGDALYIVESGSVKVVMPSPEGEDAAIIATLDRGSFFGELAPVS